MARRWRAFDVEAINREFAALPLEDHLCLQQTMLAYRSGEGEGYVVRNYGEGLMMVKDAAQGQGRCLFFSVHLERGTEILTALLVYKKESQEAPQRVLDTARRRLRETP